MQNKIKKTALLINEKSVKSNYYNDFYFNSIDAVGESEYVFLNANSLEERFKLQENFVLAELGFGTGLNFLLTWKLWLKTRKKNSFLHYVSIENRPLTSNQLEAVYKNFLNLKKYSSSLIDNLPHRTTGIHDVFFEDNNIRLTLVYNDFSYLNKLDFLADAWFLDGFSPSKNDTAWSEEIIKFVFNKTKFQGSFSSFTSSSSVQKKLKKVGFEIFKKKGFLKKREMIFGLKKFSSKTNYSTSFNTKKNIEPVAIIGAGITGCSIAYSLKKRNIDCFIIDKNKSIGGGASGNLIAFQLPKLTLDESSYGIFSLRSFLYSRSLVNQLKASPATDGVVVFPSKEREIIKFQKLIEMGWRKSLLNRYSGEYIDSFKTGLHFPYAGIVDNKKFLKRLSTNIKLINEFNIINVKEFNSEKTLIADCGKTIKAKSIVWANGFEMKDILKNELIIPVSGQVTYLKENDITKKMNLNFSFGKFFSQSYLGWHQTGSTFSRENFKASYLNDKNNINQLPKFIRDKFEFSSIENFDSRFSIRASTKDRLPFFGNIKDNNEFFIGGMGSWGFIQAPFLAEVMVKKILGEPIFLENFIINSLDIKNKL